MFLGEVGLLPREFKALSWDEVDSMLAGHHVRQQQAMYLPRLIAWETHNLRQLLSEKPEFSPSPEAYLPLPAIDKPKPVATARLDPDFLARIAARLGHPITLLTD